MTTTAIHQCDCGRRMSQYARECRKCATERSARLHAEVSAIVASGHCPQCGSGLRHNLSIAGWWQCEQYGADSHRARPDEPQCSWQGFTE